MPTAGQNVQEAGNSELHLSSEPSCSKSSTRRGSSPERVAVMMDKTYSVLHTISTPLKALRHAFAEECLPMEADMKRFGLHY